MAKLGKRERQKRRERKERDYQKEKVIALRRKRVQGFSVRSSNDIMREMKEKMPYTVKRNPWDLVPV